MANPRSLRFGSGALLFLLVAGSLSAQTPAPIPSYQVKYATGSSHAYTYSTRSDVQSQLTRDIRTLPSSGAVPLIPTLTGATTPSGKAAWSGVYSAGYEGWRAFDGSTGSLWLSNMDTSSVWIEYEFPDAEQRLVTSYQLTYANGSCCEGRAPKNWNLQGWDGFRWITVDTRTEQTGWYANSNRTFQVASPGAYRKYRLTITADNYNRTYPIHLVSIASFQLFGFPEESGAPLEQTMKTGGMDLDANITITPLQAMPDGTTLLRMNTQDFRLTKRDQNGVPEDLVLDPEDLLVMKRSIYFTQSPSGEIGALYREATEPTAITNLKRGIISSFQFRQPGLKAAVVETDVTGQLNANYQAGTTKSDAVSLVRAWRGEDYVKMASGMALVSPADVGIAGRQVTELAPALGIVTRVEASAEAATATPADSAYAGSGVGTSSVVKNTGTLIYKSSSPAKPLIPDLSRFVQTTLMAEEVLEELDPVDPRLEKDLLSSEMALATGRALAWMRTDPRNVTRVVDMLRQREARPMHSAALIDALGQEGSPAAQACLIQDLLLDSTVDAELRQRALSGVVALAHPTDSTLLAMDRLSRSGHPELARPALTVLGALCHTLSASNPSLADRFALQLEHRLRQATDDTEAAALICALGNAGRPGSLDVLGAFSSHPSPRVRREVVEAFRRFDGPAANGLLLDRAGHDAHPEIRERALEVLQGRAGVSPLLESATVLLNKSWTRTVGGSSIRAVLSGTLKVQDAPFHLEGVAEAVGHAWSYSKSLVKVAALGDVTLSGTTRYLNFSAKFHVAGNQIWAFAPAPIPCGVIKSDTYTRSTTFLSASYSIPIWGPLTANLGVGLTGTASLVVSGELNGCTLSPYATGSIIPSGAVSGYAEAYVSVWVAKGGATLSADILKASLPGTVRGTLTTNGLQAYAKADLTMQAMTGKLDLWVKVRKVFGGWRSWSWNVWKFSNTPYVHNFFTVQYP